MSCEFCDKIQEENAKGHQLGFLRVGAANVLIGACDKHFNELRNRLLGPNGEYPEPDNNRPVVRVK